MNVEVTLHGCDDSTTVKLLVVSNEELEFLRLLESKFDDAADAMCMPTMGVEVKKHV